MHIFVGSVVLLLVLNAEAQQQIHQGHHSEGFGARIGQEEPATPVEYNYSYGVRDELTGDWKSQEETRSGDRVRGRYSLLDADGSTRTVEYSVDSDSGFNAVVRRDGDQISVPNPNVRTIASTVNEYQSRRPTQTPTIYRNEDQNSRSALSITRTRLAQDARTGNVVDVQSGFGAFSKITNAQPTTRIDPTHRASFGRTILNQRRFEIPTQTVQRGQQEIQEIYAGSQYQTSHPSHSTSPIHFPLYVASAYNPRIIQELRRPERPFPVEVDVRRPTALLPNSNMLDNNRQNDGDTSNNNFAPDTNSYNTNEVYPQNIEYPIQQEEIRVPTTPVPIQGSFGPTPQYGFESNHTRSPLFRHPENVFGARINANNRRIPQSNSESISYQDDTIVTDAQELSQSGPSNAYPENFRQMEINAPTPTQVYQDFSATNRQGNTDSRIGAQRFLYPANTVPLDDNTPVHFFTRDSLSHGGPSLIHLDDNSHLRAAPVFHVPTTPVHYSSPITLDGHIYGQ